LSSTFPTDLKMQAKLARRSLRRTAQLIRYHRTSLEGVPLLFANSFPKSGTHLLTQILEAFPQIGPAVNSGLPAIVTFNGETGVERTPDDILGELHRLRPGDIAFGHLHAQPAIIQQLCQEGCAPYFILRDPRDVVVSHVYYLTDMAAGHVHHAFYSQELLTFDERLQTSIRGLPAGPVPFPDIADRFLPYLGWLQQPEMLCLQYEKLVNDTQIQLSRILEHAVRRGFPSCVPQPQAVEILAQAIDPSRSPTFRSGKTGGWKEKFTPAAKALFKQVAGDLLIQLGYEQDYDW
jgi:hypothetical protein